MTKKEEKSRVLILGAGRSGRAAEALLRAEGRTVRVLDEKEHSRDDLRDTLNTWHPSDAVVSPGFAMSHPWMNDLATAKLAVLPELELGWMRRRSRVIAVTGSNGKSTAVKWIAETLEADGRTALICGNYGRPVCDAVLEDPPPDWLVIEVSSFQLETVRRFRPEIGVLLNIYPNHLDRHGTMNAYRGIKQRLFAAMEEGDCAVIPLVEAPLLRTANGVRRLTFGTEAEADVRYMPGRAGAIDLCGTYFDNPMLGPAAAAVAAVCQCCGVSPRAAEEAARAFEPLPHRLQDLGEIGGVRYINDSKATNLAALCAALRAVPGRVHLIAGGRAKERDFSLAKDLLAQRDAVLYLIGEASSGMQKAWEDVVRCVPCGTVERAVETARERALPGECVLFSPGCTSFDRFRGFEERGDCFSAAVRGPRGKDECV